MDKSEKIVLITGASGGIGLAAARAIHEVGYKIGIHYNSNPEPAEKLKAELSNSFIIQGNLSTIEGVDAIYDVLKKEYSGNLYGLVNNAGLTRDNPIFSGTLEDYDAVMNLNVRGVWYLTKRMARFMIRKKEGRIVNVTSVVGIAGNPAQSLYGMSKAAIDNLTRTASKEFADYGILVNSVAPGYIKTAMTEKLPENVREQVLGYIPLGRMGEPEEVATLIRFLVDDCSYCTGSVYNVNGGMYG